MTQLYQAPSIFLLILIFQTQYDYTSCAQNRSIYVFTDHYHRGNNTALDISKCANLPKELASDITAVNTNTLCARFYTEENCKGKSIEMLPRSPSHHNLADWNFNDMMKSAGPCRDPCNVNVTGPIPPKSGLNISIYDRSSYQGVTQIINVKGCTVVPRKFNYRVLSINTTTENCFQLYNNVECKYNLSMGYDSVELRPGTPFHDNIGRWLIQQVKAISHCSYKCNKLNPELPKTNKTSNNTGTSNETMPQQENEVILYDEQKFMGNQLILQISDTGCINLDKFNGWEGATRSIELYKNDSCVILYTTLNCTGDIKLRLVSSELNMSSRNFSAVTRSLSACCQHDVGTVAPLIPAVSKAGSRWAIVLAAVFGLIGVGFLVMFLVRRWWYPNLTIGNVFRGNPLGNGNYGQMGL